MGDYHEEKDAKDYLVRDGGRLFLPSPWGRE
jgi:hypothetical protein